MSDGAFIPVDDNNNDYLEYLTWIDSGNTPKSAEEHEVDVRMLREHAYRTESDPLYMEWKYDGTPEKEKAWRDKVAEIKSRYPIDI
ncbi:hypothetical protein [Aeromonas enteropelogenes]|uniref:hypothetical protein n=1 Tax=Aeromonas enteropelogenes TaxID=29489 RepID=UPI0022854F02|nr:hypothetical protein [Aeromonas enteropelogenes]MCZ0752586.1 hypothetical protein [Aeromonas enteropelogenes]